MWVCAGLLKPKVNSLVVLTVCSLADRVLSLFDDASTMGNYLFERLADIQGSEIHLVHITAETTWSVSAVDMSTLSTAVAFPAKDFGEKGLAFLYVGRGQHEIEELHLRAIDTDGVLLNSDLLYKSLCGFD